MVAFGYDVVKGGIDIAVYDNNSPLVTVTLSWRKGTDGVTATNRATPWRGLFVHAYAPVIPPATLWQSPEV